MSVKTPPEKFLMTVPKPIHDWLSEEAEKLGVTVQDRVRTMLREALEKPSFSENISLHGWVPETKHPIKWTLNNLMNACNSIGSAVYNVVATERQRLNVITVSEDGGVMWYNSSNGTEVIIPVISKPFYPVNRDNEIDVEKICEAAKQVALLENRILSVCDDGEDVYEAMPFKLQKLYAESTWGWKSTFRVCINSAKTPTMTDVIKQTS